MIFLAGNATVFRMWECVARTQHNTLTELSTHISQVISHTFHKMPSKRDNLLKKQKQILNNCFWNCFLKAPCTANVLVPGPGSTWPLLPNILYWYSSVPRLLSIREIHTHRNFENLKSDLKEVRNFLKISIRAGSKFLVSVVCCSVSFPHIKLGMRAVSLGARAKETTGISSHPCGCREQCGRAVSKPMSPGYSKAPSPVKTIQPALSLMPGGHRGMQESERKWNVLPEGSKQCAHHRKKK